ncbi:MAG: hypothetical protein ABL904_11425 [Hyphomicrobiaceae bacterium]
MIAKPNPPLSKEEQVTIAMVANAIVHRDFALLATVKKSSIFQNEVFLEWLNIVDLQEADVAARMFSNVLLLKGSKSMGFDLLQVGLGGPSGAASPNPHACRAILIFERNPEGGGLRLNSISDVEPEDFG